MPALLLAILPLLPQLIQGVMDLVHSGQLSEADAQAQLAAIDAALTETRAKVMAYTPLPPQ